MVPNAILRDAIFRSGKRQGEIALRSGLHESRLSRIVRGWVLPTDDERRALAKALRIPESELFPSEAAEAR